MRGHVDAETLAANREGLLSRRRAARVTAHLADCPRCAETEARLAGVTSLLATSAVPPMPAGLASRIEAALAAEAASRAVGATAQDAGAERPPGPRHAAGSQPAAGTPAAGTPPGSGRELPPAGRPRRAAHQPGDRRSWLALRAAAVTAAVAVIAGGGYGVAQLVSHSGSTGSGASTASGPVPHSPSPERGAANPTSRMGTAAGAAWEGLTVIRSGTDYRPQTLAAQAGSVLASHGRARPGPSSEKAGTNLPPFGLFRDLPACVRRLTGVRAPRLVDLATYQGRPAAVIMAQAGANRVQVWVVGTSCTAAASDVLARASVTGTG